MNFVFSQNGVFQVTKNSAQRQFASIYKIVKVPVKSIQVGNDRRPVNRSHVKALAKDIEALGLRTPISVSKDDNGQVHLVTGAHRLAAYRILKRKRVPAFFADESIAEQWSIAENLLHLGDTYLDQCEGFARLAKIRIGERVDAGGKQPHDKGVAKISRQLGLSRRTVARMLSVASLEDIVKSVIRKYRLSRSKSLLHSLTRLPDRASRIQEVMNQVKSRSAAKEDVAKRAKVRASKGKPDSEKSATRREPWAEIFRRLEKVWRKSGVADLYEQQNTKMKVAFVRKMFSATVIRRANDQNAG